MTESQSRYSIVERLTQSKLGILENKTQLDLEIRQSENEIVTDEKSLAQWKLDVQEDVKRKMREEERKIENKKSILQVSRQYRDEKMKMYGEKIREIDKALSAIQEISNSSAKEAGQK